MSFRIFNRKSTTRNDQVDAARLKIQDALSDIWAVDDIPTIRNMARFSEFAAPIWTMAGEKSLESFESSEFFASTIHEINSVVSVTEFMEADSAYETSLASSISGTPSAFINHDEASFSDPNQSIYESIVNQAASLDPNDELGIFLSQQAYTNSSGYLSRNWWDEQYKTYDYLGVRQLAYVTRLVYMYNVLNPKKKKSTHVTHPPDTATATPQKSKFIIPLYAPIPPPVFSVTHFNMKTEIKSIGENYENSKNTPTWGLPIDPH